GALGALGGGLQTGMLETVPWRRHRYRDFETGEFREERMSALRAEQLQEAQRQHFLRTSLVERLEQIQQYQADMEKAAREGNEAAWEKAAHGLFQNVVVDSIISGKEELLTSLLEEMARNEDR